MTNDIHIETERLILHRGNIEDAQALHEAAVQTWDDLQNWMSWAFEGNQKVEAIRDFLQNETDTAILGFCKQSGQFVISTGYRDVAGKDGVVETGYWVARDQRRKGLAFEAMQAIIRHAFDDTRVQKIYIRHANGNDASEGLIRKLGFIKTGLTHNDHIRCRDGAALHTHHYEMGRRMR